MDFRKSGGMGYLSPREIHAKGEGRYCPHGTILFPPCHRPYNAMMEVRLSRVLEDRCHAPQVDPPKPAGLDISSA